LLLIFVIHIESKFFMRNILLPITILVSLSIGTPASGCNDSSSKDESVSEKFTPSENVSAAKNTSQVWELPDELVEISANVLIDEKRMACIQDNLGIIYIYNLETRSVERKIDFAGKGDYEGLAVVNKIFYVLRSDGFIYEVQEGKAVKTYDLVLNATHDTESLFYDKIKNRLLVGVKERDLTAAETKGVYSFDLTTNKMNEVPVMQIGNEKTQNRKGKKGGAKIKPSDLAIHPTSGEVYILNGPSSELLIAKPGGEIIKTIQLDKTVFPQPEGLCFTASGELYISSEGGKKAKGIIAMYKL
jgi:hypothetical protein